MFQRLGGIELADVTIMDIRQPGASPGEIALACFGRRRDWLAFADAYGDPTSGAALPNAADRIARYVEAVGRRTSIRRSRGRSRRPWSA